MLQYNINNNRYLVIVYHFNTLRGVQFGFGYKGRGKKEEGRANQKCMLSLKVGRANQKCM